MNLYELAIEEFMYDPEEGIVRRKKDGHIGWDNGRGYLFHKFRGKSIMSHRLAWLIVNGEFPTGIIDHINGDKRYNRISNLRIATYQQNNANRKGWRKSASGLKGVSPKNGKWIAQIMVNRKGINLGCFQSKEDAHAAYMRAAIIYFGEFARAD